MCERTKAETIRRAQRMIAEHEEQRTYREKRLDDQLRAVVRATMTIDEVARTVVAVTSQR